MKVLSGAILSLLLAVPAVGQQIAITNVTILPMTVGGAELAGHTLLIGGERIIGLGPTNSLAIPAETEIIDGAGKFLIPGLIDSHAHFLAEPIDGLPYSPTDALLPFFAKGVTTIVDLSASEHSLALKAEITANAPPAPQILTALMLDGVPPVRPDIAIALADPAAAEAAVRDAASQGYDFIKVYSALDLPTYEAILATANALGLPVLGHIPGRRTDIPVEAILQPGFIAVAHAEEFAFRSPDFSGADIARFVELMRTNDTALMSTLFLDQQILAQIRDPQSLVGTDGIRAVDPILLSSWFTGNRYTGPAFVGAGQRLAQAIEFNDRLVLAAVEGGVAVMAGTDTIVPGLVPGYALHRELVTLVEAGLTPLQALETATRIPAEVLGIGSEIGTIEPGKRATLLLLDADPRMDIGNADDISAVIASGQVFTRDDLDQRLAELEETYAAVLPLLAPAAAAALSATE